MKDMFIFITGITRLVVLTIAESLIHFHVIYMNEIDGKNKDLFAFYGIHYYPPSKQKKKPENA